MSLYLEDVVYQHIQVGSIMSFKHIMTYVNRPDERITLMGQTYGEKDEFGFSKKIFGEIQELQGVIQRDQDTEIAEKGTESEPLYTGYFIPDFIINTANVNDYRIKYERPHETLILKIREYNPNLFLEHSRDHIQLRLILEKKNV